MKLYVFLFLLTCNFSAYSQNFSKVDRHAQRLDYSGDDIAELALSLTSPFPDEVSKVRAIYAWITDHIAYDCKKRNAEKATFITYETEEELARKKEQLAVEDALNTLKTRKGICYDYTYLFKYLCAEINIPTEVVLGKVKKSETEIGKDLNTYTHTWNAVKIQNQWSFVDATWGSGYTDGACTEFTKESRNYFLCSPEEMIYTHFPEDPQWQLLDNKVTTETFLNFPLLNHHLRTINLESFLPKSGLLKRSKEKVQIKLLTNKSNQNFIVIANNELIDAEISENSGTYLFSFYIPENVDYVRICFERHKGQYTQCIVYKVF